MILSAVYALTLYRRVVFGKLEKPSLAGIKDMSAREIAIMAPLVVLTLLLGFYPKPVIDTASGAVNAMIAPYKEAIGARQAVQRAAACHRTTSEIRPAPMLNDYAPIFPELFILLASMVLLLWGVYHRREAGFSISIVSILVLGGAALLIAGQPSPTEQLFNGAFVNDSFARFMKILTLAGSAFTILLSFDYMRRERLLRFEYPVLILLSTAGMMLTISANDLISLYLALEFQSLALYVLAAFRRDRLRSTEAGLKYFVLGALSSGLLLYGSSLVYGYTGAHGVPANRRSRARGARRSHRLRFRPGLHPGGPRLQDRGGPLPYVDARRLRRLADARHRLFRGGGENVGHGHGHPDHPRRLPGCGGRNGSRSLSPSRSPRWRLARSPQSDSRTSSGCSPIPPSAMSATR